MDHKPKRETDLFDNWQVRRNSEENRNNNPINSTNPPACRLSADKAGTGREALFRLSLDAYQKSDTERALRYLNRLIELNPDHAGAFNQAGIIACEMGDLEGAKTLFIAAVQKDPAFVDAQRNYAEVLLELEDYENGIQTYMKIIENHPDDVPTLQRLAELFEEVGRNEEALSYARKFMKNDPKNHLASELMETLEFKLIAAEDV